MLIRTWKWRACTRQLRWGREDGLKEGKFTGSEKRTDSEIAKHLKTEFKEHKLMHATPTRVAGDKAKLKVFTWMLRDIEKMKAMGYLLGPYSYSVAISVTNNLISSHENSSGGTSDILKVALRLYDEFRSLPQYRKTRNSGYVYSAVMHSLIRANRPEECRTIFQDMLADGIQCSTSHYALLIAASAKCRDEQAAWATLNLIRQASVKMTPQMLHSMINACQSFSSSRTAVMKFSRWGVRPDPQSMTGLVQCCLREARVPKWGYLLNDTAGLTVEEVAQLSNNIELIEADVKRNKMRVSSVFVASLVQAKGALGKFEEAHKALEQLEDPPCFYCYSSFISCCARACLAGNTSKNWIKLAEDTFYAAVCNGATSRSAVLYSALMSVYAEAHNATKAELLLRYIQKSATSITVTEDILFWYMRAVRG